MAAFGNKHGGLRQPTGFVGVVGRQSKKKAGKQGMHHHPMMAELGENVPGGLKPTAKRKAGC